MDENLILKTRQRSFYHIVLWHLSYSFGCRYSHERRAENCQMPLWEIWKAERSGNHASATSAVSVEKCCREVLSSSGGIPVSLYQPPVSRWGQRHPFWASADLAGAEWVQSLQRWWLPDSGLYYGSMASNRVFSGGFLIFCFSPCDGGRSFFGVPFCGAALGSFLEAWPKACSSGLQQFCKCPLLYVKSLPLKITRVVSGFCHWILTDRGANTASIMFYFLKKNSEGRVAIC